MPAAPSGDWKTPPTPESHPCRLPRFTYQDAARQWQCECGQVWVLVRQVTVGSISANSNGQAPYPALDLETPLTDPLQDQPVYQPQGRMPDFGEMVSAQEAFEKGEIQKGHSPNCAHTKRTGMCTCAMRTKV